MSTQPNPIVEPSQPGQPIEAPSEVAPPSHDIDTPAPGQAPDSIEPATQPPPD
jgi:hypothetical protein